MNKNLTRNLTVLGSFVALVCIVFVVTDDVVHHGRSPADRGHDHVLDQAVEIYRDIDDRSGEAEALNERGTLHRASGNLAQAEGCHRHALDLARAIALSWDEAHALDGLGHCALAAGRTAEGEARLRQALVISCGSAPPMLLTSRPNSTPFPGRDPATASSNRSRRALIGRPYRQVSADLLTAA
jgi:hypothetical protein